MSIKNELKNIIYNSLKTQNISFEEENIVIEIPKDKNNGDFSCNVAFRLTKQLNKRPKEIANDIANNITSNIIKEIKIMDPGFINFYISDEYFLSKINEIIEKDKNYGKNISGNNQKINIEFVSANPTGILHIGHGRGATYGDNLARILSFNGYDVTKEYYINDAGNQMNNLGISIKERYKELNNIPFEIPEDGYHGKEIIDIAKSIYDFYGNSKLDADIEFFKKEGLDILLNQIKKDLDRYRVNFDVFTSEQSLYDKGKVDQVLMDLQRKNYCYINEDALWLKTSDFNDEKDRVLIKNDGNYTYLLPDIAYHMDKIDRGYNQLIDVLGSDHHGYINRIKAAITMLGKSADILDIKILQMVRLIKDNQELKLSKRTGKTITLNDLIDEVGVNATRFFFSSKSLDTQMDFDLDLAVKNSNDNPVYYIEYANARICSILRNYRKEIALKDRYVTLTNPKIIDLIIKMINFEDVVYNAGKKQQPHIIVNYLLDLVSLFHSYYASEKVITEDELYTEERILLLQALKIVINNSLDLIGIIPREEM